MSKSDFSKIIRIILFLEGKKLLEKTFTKGPVIFGRLPASDIFLDFGFVSRQHCQVVQEGSQFFLVDLNSRNGVFVAGKTVDRYQIDKKFEFELEKIKVQILIEDFATETPRVDIKTSESHLEQTIVGIVPLAASSKAAPVPRISKIIPPSAPPVSSISPQSNAANVAKEVAQVDRAGFSPLLAGDFLSELVQYHPGVKTAAAKRIEAILLWHDQVFEVREFDPSEKITLGASAQFELRIPSLPRGWSLANVEFNETQCFIPKDKAFSVTREGQLVPPQELLQSQQVKSQGSGFAFRMGFTDVLNVELGGGMRIFLRYIPALQKLPKKKLTEPEQALKQAMLGSALMHGVMALLLMISVPEVKNVPKLENVPERFAKLLVEPPKPILPVVEPPKPPEPKKEVAKPERKRPEPKPKKIAKVEPKKLQLPKKLVEQNRFPIVVKNTTQTKPEPKPVKVESLGALAALGAMSDTPMSELPQVNNIKINKNAGGIGSKVPNTSGALNAIPSSGGKLMAAGGGQVKTGGKGIGSGKEYGVQGLSGASGSRGIAAAVVGTPQLASSSGKVEGLTRAQVMAVVQKYLGEVQQCYERNLLSNPNLAGRMEFEWDIQPAGSVSAVRIRRSTVQSGDGLGECVKGVFAKMQFPKAKNGQSTSPNIGFPFGRL